MIQFTTDNSATMTVHRLDDGQVEKAVFEASIRPGVDLVVTEHVIRDEQMEQNGYVHATIQRDGADAEKDSYHSVAKALAWGYANA